ncbi:DUF7501 family protein [Natronoarchaeum rubrum]|uniref:DUF7501 family protein n=1 Tax=Natronoarchaeum rubrum TaxID=755311 RepID=UPI0021111366|nr:hypothetical protein [Natronoarchaeum rubrum]
MNGTAPTTNWTDPSTCPFCDAALADPGAGFIDHIHDSPDCESGFDQWRSNVSGDMGGEWSG